MKRRHLREDAIELCKELKQRRPEISFGADLIVGFPTETEEMFQNTLNIIEECQLDWIHAFSVFSKARDTGCENATK